MEEEETATLDVLSFAISIVISVFPLTVLLLTINGVVNSVWDEVVDEFAVGNEVKFVISVVVVDRAEDDGDVVVGGGTTVETLCLSPNTSVSEANRFDFLVILSLSSLSLVFLLFTLLFFSLDKGITVVFSGFFFVGVDVAVEGEGEVNFLVLSFVVLLVGLPRFGDVTVSTPEGEGFTPFLLDPEDMVIIPYEVKIVGERRGDPQRSKQ